MQPYLTYPTGSTYIVGHGADIDTVLLFETKAEAEQYKNSVDAELCGSDYGMDSSDFYALRSGKFNEIVCWDHGLFLRWCAFTELAKALRLTEKIDRIELSKAIVEEDSQAAVNITHRPDIYDRMHQATDDYLGA